jgi:hypothetical protein
VIGTGSDSDDKSVGDLAGELSSLVVTYAKQETIDPLKSLGRFVAFGIAGAILIAVGGAVLTLAAVRLLQNETGAHLSGNLTWVPYMGGILLALAGAGWSLSRITKGLR